MVTRFSSSSTLIIRISVVSALLLLALTTQVSGVKAADPQHDATQEPNPFVIERLSAHIGEQSFWRGIVLPTRQVQVVLFVTSDRLDKGGHTYSEVLAIVPQLNATYRFRVCASTLIPEGGSAGWLGWNDATSVRITPDVYLSSQLARFSDFVVHARRIEHALTIDSDPSVLFRVDSEFGIHRTAQIEHAARTLFHKRPLSLTIAGFSRNTDQILALVPSLGKLVTFSVVHSCSGDESIEIGRIEPLKSIRPDLRKRIEANSKIAAIK